jgi:hypothetical protein
MQRWVGLGVLANDLLVLAREGHERLETARARRGTSEMDEMNAKPAELSDLAAAGTSIPDSRSMSALISAPESS